MAREEQVTEEKVRELAYSLWEQEGRPEGKDVEHYYKARRILEQQAADAALVTEPQPAPMVQAEATRPGERRFGRRR